MLAVREVQARVGFWVERKYPDSAEGEESGLSRELRIELEATAFAGFVNEYSAKLPTVHAVWSAYENAMANGARRPDKGEKGNGKVSFVVAWPSWWSFRKQFEPVRSNARRRSCKEPELVAFALHLGGLKPEQLASLVDGFLLSHPVVKELSEWTSKPSLQPPYSPSSP